MSVPTSASQNHVVPEPLKSSAFKRLRCSGQCQPNAIATDHSVAVATCRDRVSCHLVSCIALNPLPAFERSKSNTRCLISTFKSNMGVSFWLMQLLLPTPASLRAACCSLWRIGRTRGRRLKLRKTSCVSVSVVEITPLRGPMPSARACQLTLPTLQAPWPKQDLGVCDREEA